MATSFAVESDPPRKPRTIVIVDDDPVLVDTLRDVLQQEGYRVRSFTDAAAALAYLRSAAHADLVLVDYLMPKMTGPELVRALAESGVHPRTLLFTALGMTTTPASLGVSGVLRKPVDLDGLLAAVAEAA